MTGLKARGTLSSVYGNRLLILPVLVALLLGNACGGGDAPPNTRVPSSSTVATTTAPSATPTAAASPTPAGEQPGPDGFRRFAAELNTHLNQGDMDFLIDRLRATDYTCGPEDVPQKPGGPACMSAGQQFKAFPAANWRSEGGLAPVDSVIAQFNDLKTTVLVGSQDPFGPALLAVYATDTSQGEFHAVITTISRRPEGPRRVIIAPRFEHSGNRWEMVSNLTAYALADDFLKPSVTGWQRLPGWTRLGKSRTTEEEILQAVAEAALRMSVLNVKAFQECTPQQPCVSPLQSAPSLADGVIPLSYRASATATGGALVVMGRDSDGVWRYWFTSQLATHRLINLPGDLIICGAGEAELVVGASPSTSGAGAGTFKTGTVVSASEFLLTEPGSFDQRGVERAGQGWYRVKGGEVSGWVPSRFTSAAAQKDCTLRDQLER